ncbi:MAG: 3-oxoacyl-ACP reductase FabG [Methylococcaceae bacterium]|nr:3-oxoacyl-ACP reductase FabG [Methylococcaceae bacterium]
MTTRIALVSGASRGIGRAIALNLVSEGYTVIGTATTEAGAEQISAAISAVRGSGVGMKLDVSSAESIEVLVKAVTSDFGPPAILVNNAGITRDNLLMRMKDEEWDAILETNLSSVFRMSRACLRGMLKARYGRIINITSVVGLMGNAGQANYSAAKAGIIGFSKSLAREVGSRNITVNSVAPGFIDTDMTRALPESQRQSLIDAIPLARLGEAEEVAYAVAFLASERASYISGETLHVNGGMFMP